MRIGVLAVQGDFERHIKMIDNLGCDAVEVRYSREIEGLKGLIIPGGESTTFHLMLSQSDLGKRIEQVIIAGLPVWGTCAGAILLGKGAEPPQPRFNAIDIEVIRNAYGRQVDSFIAPLSIPDLNEGEFPGVFIRAPIIKDVGSNVEILASFDGRPVMARQGNVLVSTFHPELTDDVRIHRYFTENLCEKTSLVKHKIAG